MRFLYSSNRSEKKDPNYLSKDFLSKVSKISIPPVLSHEIEDEGTANRD